MSRPSLEDMISAWAGARWDPAIYELPQEEAPSPGELVAGVDGPRPMQDLAGVALLGEVQDRPVAPGGQRGSVEGGPPTSTAAAIPSPSAATEAA